MVVVVGGGATGLGVAWDLQSRGIPVTVVEQGDLGHGTSGRFHGLLHSGGRYVVRDPAAARECWQENQLLRRIAPSAIEDTGGYFVDGGPDSDPKFLGLWLHGCRTAGIPVREEPLSRVRALVPDLNPGSRRAFWVPDAVLEGFRMLQLLAGHLERQGGRVLTHTRVDAVALSGGRAVGVDVEGPAGREHLACDLLINAAGPWAGELSQLYGDPIPLQLGGGLMLIFAHRRTPVVVNRLGPPGDGDILVPHQSVAILGTTDVPQADPAPPAASRGEARRLMDLGRILFPSIDAWRVLRAFAGVRPLYQPPSSGAASSRWVTRDFTVIDHEAAGGPAAVLAVVGGKFTTFRAMAERTGDAAAAHLGVHTASRTRGMVLEPLAPEAPHDGEAPAVCECEHVGEDRLNALRHEPLGQWRTQTWFAMGPCQGTFCVHRGAGIRRREVPGGQVRDEVGALRAERDRGFQPVLWGANAQEWALNRAVRRETLGEPL